MDNAQALCKGLMSRGIKIVSGGIEYEFDIDVQTGRITKFDKDHFDRHDDHDDMFDFDDFFDFD